MHPEQPARLTAIVEHLAACGILARLRPLEFGPASPIDLALAHEPAYVELVRLACEQEMTFIGSMETQIGPESHDAAALAAGGVLAACDAVMAAAVRRAFCAVRPPGHHAGRDRASGFCLFNHVAIAAEHLLQRHGLQRVAIVDIDAHHGNGTEQILGARAGVLYFSVHENSGTLPFPGTGEATGCDLEPLRGGVVNIPLPAGTGDDGYQKVFGESLLPALNRFAPQFILVSAGFDAADGDPIAHLRVSPAGFGWMAGALVAAASRTAAGRLVSVLEGGYEPALLARCVAAHVAALEGRESGA